MINFQQFLEARNSSVEHMVLCNVLSTRFLSPEIRRDFFEGTEQRLFDAIEKQVKTFKSIDIAILKKEHAVIISEVLKSDPTCSPEAIEILKEAARKRTLARNFFSISGELNITEIIAKIYETANSVAHQDTAKYSQKTELSKIITEMEKNFQAQNKKIAGYSTGIIELDKTLGGFEKGKFYCIGALKKTGKSRFGVYLSMKFNKQGAGVFWDSLEMSSSQLNLLAISNLSGVNSSLLNTSLNKSDFEKVKEGFLLAEKLNWSIYRCRMIHDLRSRILCEKQDRDVGVVFVDFIQRMQCDKYKNDRVREVEAVSQDLADLARDLDVAVIAFSQLSGAAEKLEEGEVPDMSYMKESQAIAENADAILVLHNIDRNSNPIQKDFSGNANYVNPRFKIRVDQRYDLSGAIINASADLRICSFQERSCDESFERVTGNNKGRKYRKKFQGDNKNWSD